MSDEKEIIFMKEAIKQANLAAKIGEVPVGAVICLNDEIIAAAHNQRETSQNATAHAEILAINIACEKLESWRLNECDLYVTLEPCPMCSGAIINSRIKNVFFGAYDPKAGCMGSVININNIPFNHHANIKGGILQDECSAMLKNFFLRLR